MTLQERGEFIKLLRSVEMTLLDYENFRKLPEPSPAAGSGKATVDAYNKYRWPGPCCFPNHPTACGAGAWNCATVICSQPIEDDASSIPVDVALLDTGGNK